ncbi:hypothetical protein [Aureliella helgolandensis]|nr:hypothetical protein [Aureliella helgolandensis]
MKETVVMLPKKHQSKTRLGFYLAGLATLSPVVGCSSLGRSTSGNPSPTQLSNQALPQAAAAPTPSQESHPIVPVAFTEPAAVAAGEKYSLSAATPPPITTVGFRHGGQRQQSGECSHCNQVDCGCSPEYQPQAGARYRDAQEYIFDGGDQQPTVIIRDDWSAAGVDPTDTVIYYETEGGQICVKPTNRVPIYAPRFGAVRQVTGLQLSARAVGTERILAPIQPSRFEDHNLANSMVQPVAPHGEEQVRLLDAFQENQGGIPIAQVLPLMRMSEARVPHEAIDFFRSGIIMKEDIPVLGKILQGALTWYTPESLGVMIEGKAVAMTRDTAMPQEIYVYETEDKCSIRICKAASHTIAHSGDIVSFTIRFDNVGGKEVRNAVILDSLSPRLEYIGESQQCSLNANFTAAPNEVGSDVLRWEIEAPLEASEGGVISFDCRVR